MQFPVQSQLYNYSAELSNIKSAVFSDGGIFYMQNIGKGISDRKQ